MDLGSFKIIEQADQIGSAIWEEVIHWKYFEKDTIGKQLVRAADSISANLSEAYGRYSWQTGNALRIMHGDLFVKLSTGFRNHQNAD